MCTTGPSFIASFLQLLFKRRSNDNRFFSFGVQVLRVVMPRGLLGHLKIAIKAHDFLSFSKENPILLRIWGNLCARNSLVRWRCKLSWFRFLTRFTKTSSIAQKLGEVKAPQLIREPPAIAEEWKIIWLWSSWALSLFSSFVTSFASFSIYTKWLSLAMPWNALKLGKEAFQCGLSLQITSGKDNRD